MNSPDPKHYLLAVTRLHRKRPVVTTRAVYNVQGVKLLDQGVGVDERLYERLTQHRLLQPVDECLASEPAVTGRVLREAAQEALQRWDFFARMLAAAKTREVVLHALESTPLPAPVAFSLTLARESYPALFDHSVLAAITAGYLVWTPVASRHDVAVAVAAGLLHDLGMLYADPVLWQPEHLLNSEQRRQLYAHPVTGPCSPSATTSIRRTWCARSWSITSCWMAPAIPGLCARRRSARWGACWRWLRSPRPCSSASRIRPS